MQVAKIIFNDTASQFNKDLTDFLRRNLETAIRRGQMTFHFKIAKTSDIAELRNMGIKRLPAMLINNRHFIGVPDIIGEIRNRVKNSKAEAPTKTDEEVIREFQIASLGNVTKDEEGHFKIVDDPEADENEDMMAKYNREIERRNLTGFGEAPARRGRNTTQGRNTAPSRNTVYEHDDSDDDEPKPRKQRSAQRSTQRQQAQPARLDNVDIEGMEEPMESLKNISRNSRGDDARDDQMMAALLAKMG